MFLAKGFTQRFDQFRLTKGFPCSPDIVEHYRLILQVDIRGSKFGNAMRFFRLATELIGQHLEQTCPLRKG